MRIFRHKYVKFFSAFLALNILIQAIAPTAVLALTSGPTQPEVQAFKPVEMTDMVDLFTGDFSYNIPLMDIDGYPINLSYNANVTMDQEASWVGLGWNINPGVINRSVRGVPDDFSGDVIERQFNMEPHVTYGAKAGFEGEVFGIGLGAINASLGISNNNYNGFQLEAGISPKLVSGNIGKGRYDVGLSIKASSSNGIDLNPTVSYSSQVNDKQAKNKVSCKIGASYNTQEGTSQLSFEGQATCLPKYFQQGQYTWNFGMPVGIVKPDVRSENMSLSFSAGVGPFAFGGYPQVKVEGYRSSQTIVDKSKAYSSYGYLYEQKAAKEDIVDYNREKDVPYSTEKPYVPVTNHSYDMFSASGQGVSGSFRPYRNDVGSVFDPYSSRLGVGALAANFELGFGNVTQVGADLVITLNYGSTGRMSNVMRFANLQDSKASENVFFKQLGEKSTDESTGALNKIGGFKPVRLYMGDFGNVSNSLLDDNNTSFTIPSKIRTQRANRSQSFVTLNARNASNFGRQKQVVSYKVNSFSFANNAYNDTDAVVARVDSKHREHHISEITTIKPDGFRYVFGIPAYNNFQEEFSFAKKSQTGTDDDVKFQNNNDLVKCVPSDASVGNSNEGTDKFFDYTRTPAHAHSYLLTEVLSPDYEDKLLDGPTPDDYGTYTRINYSKAYDAYKWRNPFTPIYKKSDGSVESFYANFQDNNHSTMSVNDNRGNFVYGEKEVWYIHSIETKTQVAEFVISKRTDAYECENKYGGIGSNSLYKLDEIRLYNREDKEKNTNPTPIKTVHFVYETTESNMLCGEIPNAFDPNDLTKKKLGKLTLKQVYFTFGNSQKGKFSPYTFQYTKNEKYDSKSSDRWGTFKSNNPTALSNGQFPYATQDKNTADENAQAWSLKSIILPSGGKISVELESDNYAYVQDKKAMTMDMIVGAGKNDKGSESSTLFSAQQLSNNDFFYFNDKSNSQTGYDHIAYLKKNMKPGTLIYFKFLINIEPGNSAYEYVSGYGEVEDIGKCTEKTAYGYVHLKNVSIDDNLSTEINPISRAGLQYVRVQHPKVHNNVMNVLPLNPNDISLDLFKSFLNTLEKLLYLVSINLSLSSREICSNFKVGYSWMRFPAAAGVKYGGGSRVKQLLISDEWNSMNSSGKTQTYGQEYTYTKQENGMQISSGVAANEPMIGGEENAVRYPVTFDSEKYRAPGNPTFVETPFGESFYPSAMVGYSRVSVRSIQNASIQKHATGTTVSEFYTAKDFPVKSSISKAKYNGNPMPLKIMKFFGIMDMQMASVSQGYAFETNDMHGKPSATKVYAQGDMEKPISSVEYKYKLSADGTLDNTTHVLSEDGKTVKQALVGVDYDIIGDQCASQTLSTSPGVQGQVLFMWAAIFPVLAYTVFPKFSYGFTDYTSVGVTKVINRSGLLDETAADDAGSKITTKNMLYDAKTGDILLTQTSNQFDDPVYNFTYPAHFAYDQMQGSYLNAGLIMSNVSLQSAKDNFFVGDELGVEYTDNTSRKTVLEHLWVENTTPLKVIDKEGNTFTSLTTSMNSIVVVRSGHRNMQSLPIGSITCLANPLTATGLAFDKILSASATEYSFRWKKDCNCVDVENRIADVETFYNPFVSGLMGKVKPKRSYTYVTNRTQSNDSKGSTNTRIDGIFKDFTPFWQPPTVSNPFWAKSDATTSWTWTSEVTEVSPYGMEMENKDALGRYNAALFGYRNSQNTAVSNNAQSNEIGFDGFEDYLEANECSNDHFSFRKYQHLLSDEEAHTGKYSIVVPPKTKNGHGTVSITKVIDECVVNTKK